MIFSRKRGAGRQPSATGRPAADLGNGYTEEEEDTNDRPEFGPYDVSQAPTDERNRIDLGALRIPTVDGVDIQLEAAPGGEIHRVQLAHGGSRLQLGAFAAPKSEGVWDEIRAELRTALLGSGAKLAEVQGEYGPELQARVSGGQGTVEVRHIGIDGPRWFIHGVYVGAAAVDPDLAGPLREALRGVVVDRGAEARPVKEPLPLRLPPEAAAQLAEVVATEQAAAAETAFGGGEPPDEARSTSTDSGTGAAPARRNNRGGRGGRAGRASQKPGASA